jgi:uncharacterized membrane protein (DUF373 family)
VKSQVKKPQVFFNVSVYFATAIRILLNILLIIILAALAVGVFKAGYDLVNAIDKPLDEILRQILIDVAYIFALAEMAILTVGYLQEGRVHVRYIVDTVLIIMLIEIVSAWFKDPKIEDFASLALITSVLVAARVAVTRFAPGKT